MSRRQALDIFTRKQIEAQIVASHRKTMTKTDYTKPADLYLGTDWTYAHEQGPRHFRTAAHAIRFALEEAAPVSLRGALLRIGKQSLRRAGIEALYYAPEFPLPRKLTQAMAA